MLIRVKCIDEWSRFGWGGVGVVDGRIRELR